MIQHGEKRGLKMEFRWPPPTWYIFSIRQKCNSWHELTIHAHYPPPLQFLTPHMVIGHHVTSFQLDLRL